MSIPNAASFKGLYKMWNILSRMSREKNPSVIDYKRLNWFAGSFRDAIAVKKLLRSSKRRVVHFPGALDQAEAGAKLRVK